MFKYLEGPLFNSVGIWIVSIMVVIGLPFLYWAARSRIERDKAEGLGTLLLAHYFKMVSLLLAAHASWLLLASQIEAQYMTKDSRFACGLLLASCLALIIHSVLLKDVMRDRPELGQIAARTVGGCALAISGFVSLVALVILCTHATEKDAWDTSSKNLMSMLGLVAIWGAVHLLMRRRLKSLSSARP